MAVIRLYRRITAARRLECRYWFPQGSPQRAWYGMIIQENFCFGYK